MNIVICRKDGVWYIPWKTGKIEYQTFHDALKAAWPHRLDDVK